MHPSRTKRMPKAGSISCFSRTKRLEIPYNLIRGVTIYETLILTYSQKRSCLTNCSDIKYQVYSSLFAKDRTFEARIHVLLLTLAARVVARRQIRACSISYNITFQPLGKLESSLTMRSRAFICRERFRCLRQNTSFPYFPQLNAVH